MKKSYKIALLIIVFLLVITVTLGSSYSFWQLTHEQTNNNQLTVANCFSITFTENSESINLRNSYPLNDERGMLTSPYSFTIKNNCNTAIPYTISLNTLTISSAFPELTKLGDQYIRVSLTGTSSFDPVALNTLLTTTSPISDSNINTTYVLKEGTLAANSSAETYNLRLWVSESAADGTVLNADGSTTYGTNVMNKAFEARIVVHGSTGNPSICALSNDVNSNGVINIGDEVTCGTESFYVYDNTGDNLKMLTKYNLYVGGEFNSSTYQRTDYSNPSGIQNGTMKGSFIGAELYKGVTAYGNIPNNYEGSYIETYVNNYSTYLSNNGVTNTASLITVEELLALGCNSSTYSCQNAPEFVVSSSYWTKTRDEENTAYQYTVKSMVSGYGLAVVADIHSYGVRPVLTISKNLFK